MSEIEEAIRKATNTSMSVDDRLQDIFKAAFIPKGEEGIPPNPGQIAYGYMAVDVAVRLANVFLAIKNPGEHRHFRAICDLTFELNANDFWIKNAGFLTPMLHVCLNTYRDGVTLLAERTLRGEYSSSDALISASRAAPLEIFPMIAYLVGGPQLMATVSLRLKLDLAPYFLG